MTSLTSLTPEQIKEYGQAARPYYSDKLAYHGWSHAEAVVEDVIELADRAESRGLVLAKGALIIAGYWHDAGFHEDHEALGFPTKEHYSAQLLKNYLEDKPVGSYERGVMNLAILGTIHGAHRHNLNALALHRADIANIGGPYDGFKESSLRLWREHTQLHESELPWDTFVAGSESFITGLIDEARHELPRLGEPVNSEWSYDTNASRNIATLITEPHP